MAKIIFVSRHEGAYNWFKKYYLNFSKNCVYKTHITKSEIEGNVIIGTLPINLAVLAKEYWHLSMNVPAEKRGQELTLEDMESFDCKIEQYRILKYC